MSAKESRDAADESLDKFRLTERAKAEVRAISGAMAHISGCLGSEVIVAVNRDKDANIFNVAHFGIVADFEEIVPTLTAKLRELGSV